MNIELAAKYAGTTVAEQTERVEKWTKRAQNAIGETLNVRLDKKTTLEGVIQSVKFHRYKLVGDTRLGLKIIWEVVMLCGSKKVERTVHVSKLPM